MTFNTLRYIEAMNRIQTRVLYLEDCTPKEASIELAELVRIGEYCYVCQSQDPEICIGHPDSPLCSECFLWTTVLETNPGNWRKIEAYFLYYVDPSLHHLSWKRWIWLVCLGDVELIEEAMNP